ncbi:MAG: ABC transporter permease [Ardenticatenaceae bacterium]|nr:ABC transporter permease [Ardenticatenaceae bacterium]HBY96277.1 peptide ABC transporter [Chloroflexota bacterium]
MGRQIVRRLFTLVPILIVVGFVTFMLGHLTPGDPAAVMAGEGATPEQVQLIRHSLGLDRPLWVQLGTWAVRVVQGDLGDSIFMQQPVGQAIVQRAEPTGLLALFSLLFAIVIGIPAGVIAAIRRNSWIDRLAMGVSLAGVCIPSFWLGILLILLFAVELHALPAAGYTPLSEDPGETLRSLLLPAFSLGLAHAAFLARITRSSMLEVLHEDYLRTACAKGLRRSAILMRHALPNVLVPVLTVIGNSTAILLSGAVTTEVVFNLPGIGRMMIQSIARRDYPVIQGVVLTVAVVYVLVNLATDIAYVFVDPRLRRES